MKRIIDGKTYNTETSEMIATWNNGYMPTDFHWYEEELHRTKKGVFFLRRDGNALSCMAIPVGNNASGGSVDIIIADDEQIREFADHCDEDDQERVYRIANIKVVTA